MSFLGHAAIGFEGARQQDLARQHEDEQARRSMLGGFLQKLAGDETVHPDVRNAASQAYLGVANMPGDKALKWDKILQPVHDAAAAVHPRPSQQFTPPPQPPLQVGGQELAAPSGTARFTPPPAPPGIFMSPEDVTAMQASRAGAEAGSQLTGQIGARSQYLNQIPELPPELKAMLGLGIPGIASAMSRTIGTGSGFAGDLRAQGEPIPANIPDNQFVNKRELAGGRVTYEASTPSWMMPTVRENTIQVPQADGSIKAYANTSVNRKAFGLPEGTTPVGVAAPPKAGVTQGKTIGGKAPTPAIMIAPPTQPGAQPRAIAVRPGSAVPTGAVTASGLSSANVPTSPIRTMAERSAAQIPIIDQVSKEVDRLDKAGKLGPMAGRWNAFMQGKVGAGDPDYSYLNDKVNMIQSAMMIIHSGGRTTGPILKKFEDMLNAGKMDAPTLKAGLRAIREQMQTYAKEGTIPGFGGGPPAPSQGGGTGDFFSQFGGAAR